MPDETWAIAWNEDLWLWEVRTASGKPVADMIQAKETAEHIVALHNADLAGRLLPEGGETRTEWGVHWHVSGEGGIAMSEGRFGWRDAAERRGRERVGQYGITRYSVHRREHRDFGEQGTFVGPWVAVDQETTDG